MTRGAARWSARRLGPAGCRIAGPPILLLRHHEPVIEPGVCYGRLDVAARPGPIPIFKRATIWSSPSRRCLGLARAIGARHRRRPRPDIRLLELDFAGWEGLAWAAVPRARLDGWAHAPLGRGAPGGETGAALIRRARSFARLLLARPGRHVVVAHAGPLALLALLLAGRRPNLLAPRPAFGEVWSA